MNRKIDVPLQQRPLDCSSEQTLTACANVLNRRFWIVTASFDDLRLAFQIGPTRFERLQDLLGLNDSELAPSSADYNPDGV